MRRVTWGLCLLLAIALSAPGCGRVGPPGFSGQKANSQTVATPLDAPKESILEWGAKEAKVRVIGFFYISKEGSYPALMKLLEEQAKQYPGKLYVKYADIRTQEGADLRARIASPGGGLGFVINGQSSITIKHGPAGPYTVNFDQDMGRFWTADDLKAAIAQEVAQAYGGK